MNIEEKLKIVFEELEKIKNPNSKLSFNDGVNYSITTLEIWFKKEIAEFKELESKF